MATFRVGVGSFNINDGSVGIGTEGSGHGNLKVEGTIKSTNIDVLGVSTFTRYSGFNADEININNRDLTLSGEYSTTGDIVVEDGASLTVGLGSTACVGSVECISVKNHFSVPVGDTAQRNETSGYAEGTVRYNRDLGTMEFFNGNEWRQFTYIADMQNSSSNRGRAVFGGGWTGDNVALSQISYVNIMSLGNALNFGDLVGNARSGAAPASSSVRGLFMGGGSPDRRNDIDYITIASEGDGIDFGNLTESIGFMGGASSSTRGLRMGGTTPSKVNTIDYVQMATLGDALDFGDLTEAPSACGGLSSPTRGFRIGGSTPTFTSTIDVVTIASKGNAIKFGDMTTLKDNCRGNVQSQTRGIIAAGRPSPGNGFSFVEFITMASEGDATMFGDLTRAHSGPAGASNQVRGLFYGGGNSTPYTNVIDYITIATTGDGIDFGDATQTTNNAAGLSDSHGGLGGY